MVTRYQLIPAYCLRLPTLILLMATLFIAACSSGGSSDSGSRINPTAVTVFPTSGPPLTQVEIKGIAAAKLESLPAVAAFGDNLAPLFIDESGVVSTTIPVVFDEVTGEVDDSSILSLTIQNSDTGVTIATGSDVFELTTLPGAPGTTRELESDLRRIVTALTAIAPTFQFEPGVEEMLVNGTLNALEKLINGPATAADEFSLADALAELEATDPASLLLLDALFSSSGLAEQVSEYATIFEFLASAAPVAGTASGFTVTTSDAALSGATIKGDQQQVIRFETLAAPTIISDEELAYKMQLYVVIKEFGQTVIKPTAKTFSTIMGPIGLIIKIPLTKVISAVLSLSDFIINKFVVALLPARIDVMTLRFINDHIAQGETTNAIIEVTASNDPPDITVLDITGQILNGMGFKPNISPAVQVKELDDLRKVLLDVTSYMLKLFRSGTSAYASAHQELNLNPDVASLPDMSWQARIEQDKFVELHSFTPDIVTEALSGLDWIASGPNFGEGRVNARTAVDQAAVVIPQPPGFAYSAGAFGEDVGSTPTRSIFVDGEFNIDATTELVNQVFSVVLSVYDMDTNQNEVPIVDANVQLTSSHAEISWNPLTGITDSQGSFTAAIVCSNVNCEVITPPDPSVAIKVDTKDGRSLEITRFVDLDTTITVSPVEVILDVGDTAQFFANVIGPGSTAVSWSATGGNVSQNGFYTAGNTPGAFTVTATSIADPSITTSADVIIESPNTGEPVTTTWLGTAQCFDIDTLGPVKPSGIIVIQTGDQLEIHFPRVDLDDGELPFLTPCISDALVYTGTVAGGAYTGSTNDCTRGPCSISGDISGNTISGKAFWQGDCDCYTDFEATIADNCVALSGGSNPPRMSCTPQ